MLRNAHYKQSSILIDRIIIFGRDAAAGQELDHKNLSSRNYKLNEIDEIRRGLTLRKLIDIVKVYFCNV